MVTTLVTSGHARPSRAPFRPRALRHSGETGFGRRDNAITPVRGDLVVRLSSGELAGTGECLPDRAGFYGFRRRKHLGIDRAIAIGCHRSYDPFSWFLAGIIRNDIGCHIIVLSKVSRP